MKTALRHMAGIALPGIAMLSVTVSCGTLRANDHAAVAPARPAATALTQLGFGERAAFTQCVPPACPTRTPKTLAAEPSAMPRSVPTSIAPADGTAGAAGPATMPTTTVTVHFALGSSTLSAAARSQLDRAVSDLATARDITITGRTDNTGPLAFNDTLASVRAQAVLGYFLRRHGTSIPMPKLASQGACCYVASNDTPAGRALNRRVEVVFHMQDDAPS